MTHNFFKLIDNKAKPLTYESYAEHYRTFH